MVSAQLKVLLGCAAARSDEAFKKVSRAFQTLSDPEKRRVFDQYGDEDRIPQHFRGGGGRSAPRLHTFPLTTQPQRILQIRM